MIESPLPYVSHKTAPFRAPVLCGNRSSGVQPISVNRQPCSCLMQWSDRELTALVCHTERRPQSPCSMWEQELNRYPIVAVILLEERAARGLTRDYALVLV